MKNAGMADFRKEDFGWIKRRWQTNDHLVVLGYNHVTDKFFTLVRRQVRELLNNTNLPFKGRHSPLTRAAAALKPLRLKIRPVIQYEGSIKVSKTAIAHRHFVFVEIFDVPTESQEKGYYQEFDASQAKKMFSSFETEVVDYIIGQVNLSVDLAEVA